ncbi:MAG: NTP transferase domain-containing protein [Candidatus Omnitrophota bacterium]|jgi:bifunctional UDP-N-acetylglucosamine pyrophosphorylase/glucosamine-1-phosphate N-acetyltransferase
MKNIAAIILAAGKGTRMKSEVPKVLHKVCGRPMLGYVLDLVASLRIKKTVTVLGFKADDVRDFIGNASQTVIQKKLLGTADAVKEALPLLKGFSGSVIVLYGDIPLLQKQTIAKLIKRHADSGAAATMLTAKIEKPVGYGRVLRDAYCSIYGIVEEKDADDFQKGIKEINTGIICFDMKKLVSALKRVKPNNRKKEYYLTDVIGILYKQGDVIESVDSPDVLETMGVNSRLELSKAQKIMQQRINEEFMKAGVSIIDPDSAFISYGVKIGQDTTIYPFTVIEKNVKIGKSCKVGPFARLREGTVLNDEVVIGNFLEISRSALGSKTLAKHFSYIGDCRIGKSVNIGAGTVTANYDGTHKNITVIEDGAFIGSDTVLIAPVRIGKAAKTGAGSVVRRNHHVAAGQTVVGVPAQPLKAKAQIHKK